MLAEVTIIQENYTVEANITTEIFEGVISQNTEVFEVHIEELGVQGLQGENNYQIAVRNGFVGSEPEWLETQKASITDLELVVEFNGQTEFNIFENSAKNNLIINGVSYFKDKDYIISNLLGAWKLIWQNEFTLTITDLLIFRKF